MAPRKRSAALAVYVEVGKRRTFASARDWPGWCRAGKDEEAALTALAEYAPRYARVTAEAGLAFDPAVADAVDVRERLVGNATTDFGAPGVVAAGDHDDLTAPEAERQAALVAASWAVLDRVAAGAPATLRKGPRGGGRDRDAVVEHVLGAEASYARTLGVRHPAPVLGEDEAIAAMRADILVALRGARSGQPRTPKGWPPRYAARRIAWHVLDHAWEIEDKSS